MAGRKRQNSSCPFASLKKPTKRNSGNHEFSVEKARSLVLSDCGSYYNQDEWLFEDSSPGNEAVEQPVTSTSRTKILLENIDLRCLLAGPLACSTLRFPVFGFSRHAFNKCLENEEV